MKRLLTWLALALLWGAGVWPSSGETIDGQLLTVVNAAIARSRLGIITTTTNGVTIAAGAGVTIVTNVTSSNVTYTLSAAAGGATVTNFTTTSNGSFTVTATYLGVPGSGSQIYSWDNISSAYKLIFNSGTSTFEIGTNDSSISFRALIVRPYVDVTLDLGSRTLRWRDSYFGRRAFVDGNLQVVSNAEVAFLVVTNSLEQRDGTAFSRWQMTNAAPQTNFYFRSYYNLAAGDALKVHSVTTTGTSNFIVLTNQITASGQVWTNFVGNNVAQTNNLSISIPDPPAVNMTVNFDGLTALVPGRYYVYGRVSFGVTANDWVGMVVTTNNVDYPPSYVNYFFNTASGGGLTYTNAMSTSAIIRLAANDQLRLKRWYGNGGGNTFQQGQTVFGAYRIAD